MVKRIYLVGILLSVVLLVSACGSKNDTKTNNLKDEQPKLTVKIGDNEIYPSVISKKIQQIDKENTEEFQSIIKNNNVPYVKLGDTIKLELSNKDTATYQLLDYVLKEDGTLKFQKSTIKESDDKFDKGTKSFALDENPAVNLSSNSKDFEVGKTIRGFKVIYSFKGDMYEYSFIIKTDADKK